MSALNRLAQFFGDVLVIFLKCLGAGGESLPLKLHACSFQYAHRCPGYFGANAIAGNERDLVGHKAVYLSAESQPCLNQFLVTGLPRTSPASFVLSRSLSSVMNS